MPVKLKHKITGEIISSTMHDKHVYSSNLWDVIERTNVYQVYVPIQGGNRTDKREIGVFEKEKAIALLEQDKSYRFEPLPDWRIRDAEPNLLETAKVIEKDQRELDEFVKSQHEPKDKLTVNAITNFRTNQLEGKFLRFLDKRTTPLASEIDVEEFMTANFKKPNPKAAKTINSTDKGVIFLKNLKAKGLIDFDDKALSHVNSWTIDTDGKIKRWFDTLHEPFYVWLQEPLSKPLSFLGRLSNSKLVLYTRKNAKPIMVKTWKMLVAIFIFLLGCYLSSGNHFDNLIEWIKHIFHTYFSN